MALTDQERQDLDSRSKIMRLVFELVENKDHWKGPIDAMVAKSIGVTPDVIMSAVMFFTATEATVEDEGVGQMHVTAPGYWEGPAA